MEGKADFDRISLPALACCAAPERLIENLSDTCDITEFKQIGFADIPQSACCVAWLFTVAKCIKPQLDVTGLVA